LTDKELDKLRVSCERILLTLGYSVDLAGMGFSRTYDGGGMSITGNTFHNLPNGAKDPGYLQIEFKGRCAFCTAPSENVQTGEPIPAGWDVTPRMVSAMQKAVKNIYKKHPTHFILDLLSDLPELLMTRK